GPFYIWDPETKEEREQAHNEITQLNKERKLEAILKNEEWKNSVEFKQLKVRELAARRILREDAKQWGISTPYLKQHSMRKKYTYEKLKLGYQRRGVDSWRYVKHIGLPLLWPECKRQLAKNPNIILMEDGAPSHNSNWTTQERPQEGIEKVEWRPHSPDFNPIE
ncbi:hypothetical protein K440DRAFT_500005, partial [Wilcoxina mikolae CBS 423.85]